MEDHARAGKLVNLYHTNGQFTSAITARTTFGIDTESNIGADTDDKFTLCAKNIVKSFSKRNSWNIYIIYLLQKFPRLHLFLAEKLKINYVDECIMDNVSYLDALLLQGIAEREKLQHGGQGKKYQDFLQSLVAAKFARDAKITKKKSEDTNGSEPHTDKARPERLLTHEEVMAQLLTILFAGFDMTTSALQFCLYHLAVHPEIQNKVYKEIQELVHSEEPTHEEITKLVYMDQVINESMRLLPAVGIIGRTARETRSYGDITIPAGSSVYMSINRIHKDPKNFPDPEKFDPNRFSDEEKAKRDPLAFAPFGWGPRSCIGSRLVAQELKIALVYILRKVSFEVNEKTVPKKGEELEIFFSTQLTRVARPIQLQPTLRK
ncbi:cytochrome P450 3A41-like [Elysia marginata]|uniref:Cytochrome P450 3A41-like n=1 Tax=Elysia marginata TaxID=1093978 RepID=A0AAV4IVA0_9GAST|nr:cytochrome P450 3A41-like [Elysia marginata]